MRVLYVSNIICRLQLPLVRCMAAELGSENIRFAATESPPDSTVTLNVDHEANESWILRAAESEMDRTEYAEWWKTADVVIGGVRDAGRIADRVRRGKLTFYASERWWKPPLGMARLLHPRFAWMAGRFHLLAQSPSFHYLSVGSYAASDMQRIAPFHGRMWNWGYFPSLPHPLPSCSRGDGPPRILWAGRMLAWKRVDTLLRAFAILLLQEPMARLRLIGHGPCRNGLEQLSRALGVVENVDLLPSMPAFQVREEMRAAHVYVLPSSAYEGWGAVVNEAMSEGCAVVASEGAGSAKTMVRDGENGFLFAPGDYEYLARLLIELSRDEPHCRRLAEAGQRTISGCWSPEIAAERFLEISGALLLNRPVPSFPDGPMACAAR